MSQTQKSYYAKSGLFSIFEKGSVFLFGFASTVLLLRALEPSTFGIWVIFLAVTSLFEVAIIGLIQNALVKYLATCKEEEYDLFSTASLTLNVLLTAACALFLFLFAHLISEWQNIPEWGHLFQIYCITSFCLIPFYQFNYIQQANLDFTGIFWSNFARKGIFFLYIAVMFFTGFEITLLGLAVFQIVGAVLGSIVGYFFAKRFLRFSKKINWKYVMELFHFGKYVFGTNLSTMLYKTIDRLMLGALLSSVVVGIYDVAIRITNLIDVPSFSVAAVVFPQGAKKALSEGNAGIRDLYEKSVGAILCLILPFILVILIIPEFVIHVIAGPQYLETVPILRITILFGLFLPFAIQFGTVLDSIGKPKINFLFTLMAMILNIFFNYLFIVTFNFGGIGAAYGTLVTYGTTFVLNQILLYKMFKVKAYRAFLHIPGFYKQAFEIAKKYLNKNDVGIETKI